MARARKAQAGRNPNTTPEVLDQLARDLKYAKAEDFIKRITTEAPALTDDQLADLASRLLPVRTGADAA